MMYLIQERGGLRMYRLKSPLSAQMELTDACNNACLHCYNYWRYLESGQRLDSDRLTRDLTHFERILTCLIKQEVRTVTFTGGEPFLRRDVLFDLIGAAKAGGLHAGVNTNGALIEPTDVKQLKTSGTDFVLVSLLSNDPTVHNEIAHAKSHKRTTEAISLLVAADLSIAVNMVVSSHNWEVVRSTAMYAQGLGADEFSATPVLPCPLASTHHELLLNPQQVKSVLDDLLWVKDQGMEVDVLEPLAHCMFSPEERVRYARFLNHRSCSAGISDMVISPEGDVRACILATENVGNLITDSWESCWGNLASWCSPELLPEGCLSCDVVDFCGGGCRVAALAETGKIDGKDPYMTEPLVDSDAVVSEIDHPTTLLRQDIVLTFPPDAGLRLEDFGCVLFCGKNFMFLSHDATKLVSYLRQKGSFSIESIRAEVDVDREELEGFLVILIEKEFLRQDPQERR